MELGKTIKSLRTKARMTQEDLAEKLGVTSQSVSKWENGLTMPDISLLPILAEAFGVSIDDLFLLTTEQRFNRIENRMDIEEELPADVFLEYEEFLKSEVGKEEHKLRATELLARLYWDRMHSYSHKVSRYAREAIRLAPGKKCCQWMLNMAEGHYVYDWNVSNHARAIDFYHELVEKNPEIRGPYCYLIDNLIADHRADEAETFVKRYEGMEGANYALAQAYYAYIALARFDEPKGDAIIAKLLHEHGEEEDCLFEAAQYYARKCDYQKAIELYEIAFEKDPKRPRYSDALMGIADIYLIQKDYAKAASAYGRIVDLLEKEWGLEEETELKEYRQERDRLLNLAKQS